MKILLNVRWPVGGIRTYLRYVYRKFPQTRYKFALIAPNCEELDILERDLSGHLTNIVTCEPNFRKMSVKIYDLLRAGGIDLIHSHGLTAGLFAAIPAKVLGVPHIVTLHDMFQFGSFVGFKGRLKWSLINCGMKLPNAIHLLGDDPERNLRQFFPTVGEKTKKNVVINSGIDVDQFFGQEVVADNLITLRMEIDISESKKILGFFGRFMRPKGFGILIDAIGILAREGNEAIVPVVASFGSGGFLEREKRLLRSRGLLGHFRFLPFQSNIAKTIRLLDGVVMPSRWEAVGLLAMETLVSGVPLLASNCVGLREVTKGTPAFSFEAEDASGLADSIRKWSMDQRVELFAAYAPDAAHRFDVQRTAKELQRVYCCLTSGLTVSSPEQDRSA